MQKLLISILVGMTILICVPSLIYAADVEFENLTDLANIQKYFKNRFPDISITEFANGVYALDPIARENWEALEEFPPYEIHIDNGETLWNEHEKPYLACFPRRPWH